MTCSFKGKGDKSMTVVDILAEPVTIVICISMSFLFFRQFSDSESRQKELESKVDQQKVSCLLNRMSADNLVILSVQNAASFSV